MVLGSGTAVTEPFRTKSLPAMLTTLTAPVDALGAPVPAILVPLKAQKRNSTVSVVVNSVNDQVVKDGVELASENVSCKTKLPDPTLYPHRPVFGAVLVPFIA